ncbi:MAG: nucleotidyltransferase domain-containing protein [Devosia sp.]
MNQQDIIAAAKTAFRDDEAVRGLFLSGSFGRGTQDEWSDVDLLAIVAKTDQRGVADRWKVALNALQPVVYWNELERGGFLINAVTEAMAPPPAARSISTVSSPRKRGALFRNRDSRFRGNDTVGGRARKDQAVRAVFSAPAHQARSSSMSFAASPR